MLREIQTSNTSRITSEPTINNQLSLGWADSCPPNLIKPNLNYVLRIIYFVLSRAILQKICACYKSYVLSCFYCVKIVRMNVYIEYVIADNFTIDALLLWLAAVTLKLPYKKWRIVLGGIVGALCAVVSVFVSGWVNYIVKLACLVLMCITACGVGKKLLWYILLVCAYTFVLGGAIIAVFNLLNIGYVTENGEFYDLDVPLFVYVLAVFFTAFLCYSVAFYVKQTRKIAPYLTKAKVYFNGTAREISAFSDSGNTLTFNGIPVCFVTKKFKGFADYFAEQTLRGKTVKIEVTTVVGTQYVTAVLASVQARGKKLQTYLALPYDKCNTPYNVILSNLFMEETTATVAMTD